MLSCLTPLISKVTVAIVPGDRRWSCDSGASIYVEDGRVEDGLAITVRTRAATSSGRLTPLNGREAAVAGEEDDRGVGGENDALLASPRGALGAGDIAVAPKLLA